MEFDDEVARTGKERAIAFFLPKIKFALLMLLSIGAGIGIFAAAVPL